MVITGARVMTSLLRNHPKSQNLMRRRICALKTLTKKILTVCLTLAMACALAIPAFADFDNGYNGYHIRNESIGGNNYLNMEGSGGPYNSRNVTVYSRTGDGDQIWSIANRGNGKKVYNSKTDSAGNAYTLNINSSNNNCNVYRDLSSNNNDSVVSNAGNMSAFTIRLVNHGNVFAYVSGNNVVWGSVAHVWNELA